MATFSEYKKKCKKLLLIKGKDWCFTKNTLCSENNCPYNTPHNFLWNKNEEKKDMSPKGVALIGGVDVSPKQAMVYNLRHSTKKPLSFAKISTKLGISKQMACKHYKNYLRNMGKSQGVDVSLIQGAKPHGGGLTFSHTKGLTFSKEKSEEKQNNTTIRLHSDLIKIKILNNLDECDGKIVPLRNHNYVMYKDDKIEIRYFNQSTTIKFKEDIVAKTEKEAQRKADARIKSFLYERYGFNQYVQLKRHYGILGTKAAKVVRDNGLEIIIYDDLDNKVRQRFDFSHEMPEIDSEHVKYGRTDSEKTGHFLGCIIKKPHYDPYETKVLIDTILTVQKDYAVNIKKHLLVQEKTLETQSETLKTLKLMQENIKNKKI